MSRRPGSQYVYTWSTHTRDCMWRTHIVNSSLDCIEVKHPWIGYIVCLTQLLYKKFRLRWPPIRIHRRQASWLHRWGDLYRVSSLWWCLAATPGDFTLWKMLLAQLHSNHTRTPSARWARGKRCTGTQFNSFGLHSTVQQEKSSHYMQVIAACDLHAFLSVQQMLTSLYRVQESDVFHFVVQVTTRKSQDIRARNTFHPHTTHTHVNKCTHTYIYTN